MTSRAISFVQRLALFLLVALAFAACSTTDDQQVEQEEEFIGRPPPPEQDDPFFAHALPAEARPADPSGRIGDSPPPDEEQPGDEEQPADEERPTGEDEQPTDDQSLAASTQTDPEIEDRRPEARATDESACFSCVQICYVDAGSSQPCSAPADDLICGWGSHSDREQAQRTARAQCDATLDLARDMPNYSEISGQCPPATCR